MSTLREPTALVTRDGAMCLRAAKAEERTATFVASTEAIDSHGDIVDQASWQLDHFKANPIVLYGHNSRELPIGKATDVAVKNGQLETTIKFASAEANPRAEEVWRLIQEGILRAVSVGFLPTNGNYEVRDGKDVFVWRAPILKEISVVPVPANHEALARMKKALADASGDIDEHQRARARRLAECETALRNLERAVNSAPENFETPALPGINPSNEKESDMDPKELTTKIEKQAVELAELGAKVKSLETDKAALEKQNAKLVEERDASNARASKAEDGLIELEIDALVGKKIKPAEKDHYVELRKTNPTLFTKMVAQLSDLNLDSKVTPMEREGTKTRSVSGGGASAVLLKKRSA